MRSLTASPAPLDVRAKSWLAAVGLAQTSGGTLERISVNSAGVQGNQDSEAASVSTDGRYVAFASFADNLVPEDTNAAADIFVRDRANGTTERVSVGANGRQSDGDSGILNLMGGPAISADGRFVAFTSDAFDLVPGETGFRSHIYVRDRQTGTTERVDVAADGTPGDGSAFTSELSADGRYVALDTFADNLVANDGDGSVDVFVHDRQTHARRGSARSRPRPAFFRHSSLASITGNGRFVGFTSTETNLVPDDTNNWDDSFLNDRDTETVARVSVGTGGQQGDRGSYGVFAREDGTSRSSSPTRPTSSPGIRTTRSTSSAAISTRT